MMTTLIATSVFPSEFKPSLSPSGHKDSQQFHYDKKTRKRNIATLPVARLFGAATFEALKQKVLFIGVEEKKLQRSYMLALFLGLDITSKFTDPISPTVNNKSQLGKDAGNGSMGKGVEVAESCSLEELHQTENQTVTEEQKQDSKEEQHDDHGECQPQSPRSEVETTELVIGPPERKTNN